MREELGHQVIRKWHIYWHSWDDCLQIDVEAYLQKWLEVSGLILSKNSRGGTNSDSAKIATSRELVITSYDVRKALDSVLRGSSSSAATRRQDTETQQPQL